MIVLNSSDIYGNTDYAPAFSFCSSMEVTYTIFINGLVGTYTPGLITVNPSWGTSYDKKKVIGSNENSKYRLELRNEFGKTAELGCAFGTAAHGCVVGLGFAEKMELSFTIHNLFAVPQF